VLDRPGDAALGHRERAHDEQQHGACHREPTPGIQRRARHPCAPELLVALHQASRADQGERDAHAE
jgi:hypothetical protein